MNKMIINKLSKIFYKRASDQQLENLLSTAVNNFDRESYLVFLDLLEQTRPELREKLGSVTLDKKLILLSNNFPNSLKYITSSEKRESQTFVLFNGFKLCFVPGRIIIKYENENIKQVNIYTENSFDIRLIFNKPFFENYEEILRYTYTSNLFRLIDNSNYAANLVDLDYDTETIDGIYLENEAPPIRESLRVALDKVIPLLNSEKNKALRNIKKVKDLFDTPKINDIKETKPKDENDEIFGDDSENNENYINNINISKENDD